MAETRFDPAPAGRIISDALSLYREHFSLLAGISLLPIMLLLGFNFILPSAAGLQFIVRLVVVSLAHAALVLATCHLMLGQQPGVMEIYRRVFTLTSLVTVIMGFTVSMLLVMLGVIFFVLPGILLGGLLVLVLPVIIVEGQLMTPSFARSVSLVKDNMPRAIGIFMFFALVANLLPALPAVGYIYHILSSVDPTLTGEAMIKATEGVLDANAMMLDVWLPVWLSFSSALTLPLGYLPVVLLYFSFTGAEGYGPHALAKRLGVELPGMGGDDHAMEETRPGDGEGEGEDREAGGKEGGNDKDPERLN